MQYAVCEIKGKQYLIKPGEVISVDYLSQDKEVKIDKVLLSVDDGKVEIGTPYLNKKLDFQVIENTMTPKIRVATYKAKANYRRVKGSRKKITKIKLS